MIARLRPRLGRILTQPVVYLLARTSISPDVLTIFGLIVNALTAWIIATEHLFIAGFLLLFSGWFDMLDGALAKVRGRTSRFGALLDSTVDRISEAVLFLGLLIFYLGQNATLETILIYVSIVGAMLVSYTRARAEGLGIEGEAGFFARPERVTLLALGLLFSKLSPMAITAVLWILAAGSNMTALHRLYYGWQQTNGN